jgi:hypothetical protein
LIQLAFGSFQQCPSAAEKRLRSLPGTRRSQFEARDEPPLQPLPAAAYEYAEWRKARAVNNFTRLNSGNRFRL